MDDAAVFSGFTKETVRFYAELRKNNNKPWFEEHRGIFEGHAMAEAKLFVAAMGERLKKIAPGLVAVPAVNKSIFRIYRDTRFSLDPTPYKTHLGIYFWDGSRPKMESAGFYFQLEPPDLYMGGGMYMIPDSLLDRYRRAVVDRTRGPQIGTRGPAAGAARLHGGRRPLQARSGGLRPRPPQRGAAQAQRALRGDRGEDPRGVLFGQARRSLSRALRADRPAQPLADEVLRVSGPGDQGAMRRG